MPPRATLQSTVLDILAGFVALCVLVTYLVLDSRNNLQLFALVTAVLYFLAGILRGSRAPQNFWLTGLLIGLGGAVPVVIMRATEMAMTAQGYVPLFIVVSLLFAIAGVETRHLLSHERRKAACLLVSFSFGIAILIAVTAIPFVMARLSTEQVNRPAPAFSFDTFDGKPVTSADLRGRVVVLAFWATWCPPCRQELPELQKVYEQYAGNSKVTFYAVGGPWGDDTAEKESAFAKQTKLNLPLAFDSRGTGRALGVSTYPALIILDAAGRIRLVHSGYDGSENLARHISREVDALAGN
jgi:peroxiredoxin